MLKVRKAEQSDLDRLLVLVALMVSESPRYNKHAFALEKAVTLVTRLMEFGGFFVAVNDEEIIGFMAGIVSEHFLSYDKCATDIGVFVLPEHRGGTAFPRLVYAFEDWAKSQGAQEIQLGVSTQVHTEQTVCMYERMGYTITSYGLLKAGV